MGVQFIMYIGIMWKLLFGPYKWKITLSMNLLGTGVTLASPDLLNIVIVPYKSLQYLHSRLLVLKFRLFDLDAVCISFCEDPFAEYFSDIFIYILSDSLSATSNCLSCNNLIHVILLQLMLLQKCQPI